MQLPNSQRLPIGASSNILAGMFFLKSESGAWALADNRHGYRTGWLLGCGSVVVVEKLDVVL